MMCGISKQELLGDKAIYQPGVARKVRYAISVEHIPTSIYLQALQNTCTLSTLSLMSAGMRTMTIDQPLQCNEHWRVTLGTALH